MTEIRCCLLAQRENPELTDGLHFLRCSLRKHPLPAASLPPANPPEPRPPPSPVPGLHELRAAAGAAEGLHPVPGVQPAAGPVGRQSGLLI